MTNKTQWWLGLVILLMLGRCSAFASNIPIVDPQIFICQSCTAPPGGDPNVITNPGTFNVGVAGNFTLQNPLLIILGVYNGNGSPTISFSGCAVPSACPTAPLTTYGLPANTAVLTAGSSGSAFSQLGLGAGGSESFANWSATDTANGLVAPSSFTLYAFALNGNLTSGNPFTIGESGAAPGSFLIAYDCIAGTGSSGGCAKNGDIGQTVFTNTGLLMRGTVPEPGSTLCWTGTGLAMLGLFRRRWLP